LARDRSGNPASPARLVVGIFVRAIETSDFERRLQQVEADYANPRVRPNRHEWRRPDLALQPIGELLLQIRCR
jgi:hypothetical protein